MGDDEPSAGYDAGPPGDVKKCPDCAESVRADARICRFCRFDFAAAAGRERDSELIRQFADDPRYHAHVAAGASSSIAAAAAAAGSAARQKVEGLEYAEILWNHCVPALNEYATGVRNLRGPFEDSRDLVVASENMRALFTRAFELSAENPAAVSVYRDERLVSLGDGEYSVVLHENVPMSDPGGAFIFNSAVALLGKTVEEAADLSLRALIGPQELASGISHDASLSLKSHFESTGLRTEIVLGKMTEMKPGHPAVAPPRVMVSPHIVCPHCQTKGNVSATPTTEKQGISGGKATGAILTAGLSLFATGLSKKKKVTQLHCNTCGASWTIS
jgi:hypothetical protein